MFNEAPATKLSRSNRRLKYGVGVNDADYIIRPSLDGKRVWCPFYLSWQNMLERCYDLKFHQSNPAYKGCSVCEEWKIFTNFKAWMESQNWDGSQLDKDLLIRGNKIYSPDTCMFVPQRVNKLLADSRAPRGRLPIGVTNDGKRFSAKCRNGTKYVFLGNFDAPKEAHEAYLKFKSKVVEDIAKEYIHDKRLHDALIRISGQIKSGEYFIV